MRALLVLLLPAGEAGGFVTSSPTRTIRKKGNIKNWEGNGLKFTASLPMFSQRKPVFEWVSMRTSMGSKKCGSADR